MTTTPEAVEDGQHSLETTEDSPTHEHCNRSVAPDTREEVLERDTYRCRTCGRKGPQTGGLAQLHIHHADRNPDDLDEHALANLTTLCVQCHRWYHQRTTPEAAPVTLNDADMPELLQQDFEILQYLAENGPARTGEIVEHLSVDLTVMAVRERLWQLMGLDRIVEERDQQLLDQDVDTNEWGLPSQIATSARGHIPEDRQQLLQRALDERVRQALDRGCDRGTIAEALDISRRTTYYHEKRARAYQFPLAAIEGQHQSPNESEEATDTTGAESGSDEERQQRLVSSDEGSDGSAVPTARSEASDSEEPHDMTEDNSDDQPDEPALESDPDTLEARVEQAIDALQALKHTS